MSFSLASVGALDKPRLLTDLLRHLRADLEMLIRRQQDTQAGATHAENRPEHAKDTRATEQSYLARGLALRVDEIRRMIARLDRLEIVDFGDTDPVALTALVAFREDDPTEVRTCWLVPCAGGIELAQRDRSVRTLTPQSPLGRALLGLRIGDEGSVPTPGGERLFEIVSIA